MTASSISEPVSVSIIIPCKGHAEELDLCLHSLAKQDFAGGFEIIVVDAAADAEVLAVCESHKGVRIVRDQSGLPPGEARNRGVCEANGQWLAFIDADCFAQNDWLSELLRPLEGAARLSAGVVDQTDDWHPISVVDNMMQFVAQSPHSEAGPREIVASCNIAIAKDDFERVGGFPVVPAGCGEDVLFCHAITSIWPGQIALTPSACVHHHGRASLRNLWDHQHRFGLARGQLMLALTERQRTIGRSALALPAVMAKRLGWLLRTAFSNHWLEGVKLTLFLPILLIGLAGWSRGFHAGCRDERYTHLHLKRATHD